MPFLFHQRGKAIELHQILAHHHIGIKRNGLTHARQSGHRALGAIDDIAHTAHIDQHVVAAAVFQSSGQFSDHARFSFSWRACVPP